MPGAPHTQSRQSLNLNPRALRVGVFCCARPHLDGVLCPRVPTLVVCLRGYCSNSAAFAVGEAGAFLLSLFELFKHDSSFSLLGGCRAFSPLRDIGINVRRGVARWQTFTRRAGVASCNTIGEQHFLLGRRFVLRSRRVSFESTFTHALATGECWRDDAWACRLRQLSIVERGFPVYPSLQNLLQRRYNGQVARRR